MDDKDYRIADLIRRHLATGLDEGERDELMAWVEECGEHRRFFRRLCRGEGFAARWRFARELDLREAYGRFARRTCGRRLARRGVLGWVAVVGAAAVLAGGAWLWTGRVAEPEGLASAEETAATVEPGLRKAFLTLADGAVVALAVGDSARVLGNGARVAAGGEELAYTGGGDSAQVNRLATPRGGEFCVALADGTRVWLNACSELRYPERFGAGTREVELEGEGYFEVARDEGRSFVVRTGGVAVRVTGTAFNVNTRDGEGVETVLVEGSVRVSGRDGCEHAVRPGQLAVFSREGNFVRVEDVDVEPYVAWREGRYVFVDETLERLMGQLSMWYDVDVRFEEEGLKGHRFTGRMERDEELGTILRSLHYIVGYRFELKGNVVVVSRK